METIKKIALAIWQLPQLFIGLLLVWVSKAQYYPEYGCYFTKAKWFGGGISLGSIVIITHRYVESKWTQPYLNNTIKHEKGHSKQSLYLGWLYLIVIGVPSIVWAGIHDWVAPSTSYYWFYTEAWADKLGGVKR